MINRLPPWFRQNLPGNTALSRMHFISELKVNTVCKEAKCPNSGDCFNKSRLTFMILGDTCTRDCKFCGVKKAKGKLSVIDLDEPGRIAAVAGELGLKYVVITSVTRDDLEDAGASIFAQTIRLIHALNQNIRVEALIPDFQGKISSIKCVVDARPEVIGHNIETIKRLYSQVRPQANYQLSLEILSKVKKFAPYLLTKSSLMLGLGEKEEEVGLALADLRNSGCDILTLGQYLAPSPQHFSVKEFIDPKRFMRYKELAMNLGFKAVLAGPLVRSSYRAEEVYYNLRESPKRG